MATTLACVVVCVARADEALLYSSVYVEDRTGEWERARGRPSFHRGCLLFFVSFCSGKVFDRAGESKKACHCSSKKKKKACHSQSDDVGEETSEERMPSQVCIIVR